MTVHPLPTPPRRTSPVPWSDESLVDLIASVRAGADLEALCARFGRGSQAMNARLRLLLPVEERKCPLDRLLPRLREVLEDPHHDWKQVMLLKPPPVPIIRPEYKGLPGLSDDHLVHVAAALFWDSFPNSDFAAQVHREVANRALAGRMHRALLIRLVAKGIRWEDASAAIDELWGDEPDHGRYEGGWGRY